MSYVISASLRCEGKTELSTASPLSTLPAVSGDAGFVSANTEGGLIVRSTSSEPVDHNREAFGSVAVACDINSTSIGRMYFPSDWV